jgi:hypothetical protein
MKAERLEGLEARWGEPKCGEAKCGEANWVRRIDVALGVLKRGKMA